MNRDGDANRGGSAPDPWQGASMPPLPKFLQGRPKPASHRGLRSRLFWFAVRWLSVAGAWVGLIVGLFVIATLRNLPDSSILLQPPHHPSVTLLAADGSLIATYGELYGEDVPLTEMPEALKQAVLATEDRRFYHHFGLDLIGLGRAVFVNVTTGSVVQGGSTITQQLAKNIFLSPDRTALRKAQEAVYAIWLERHFTKDQILGLYLNRVYLGAGAYGVDAASRRYFGKPIRQLGAYECAVLAGLLKAPTRYSPITSPERAAKRTLQVLDNMVEAGFLPRAAAKSLSQQVVTMAAVPVIKPGQRFFADWVQDQAATSGYDGDLTVVTTLDPKLQAMAEAAVASVLLRDGEKLHVSEAAFIAMSPDGAVRAMVGGHDYRQTQFNRATQALRQPGSAFKPIVYLAALEGGMGPDDRVTDRPVRIGGWEPHNYTNTYLGEITLAQALAQSINTVAVQLAQKLGVRTLIKTAHRLGITAELGADASLALGTSETSLIDLTAVYCAFASGGIGAWPHGIAEIRDAKDRVLFRRTGGGPGRVIDADHAATMNRLLSGVIAHGTGKAAAFGLPAAGKTGTTSDFRDALFVGYAGDLVAGVWFGNDDNRPMDHVTGGTLPARAWHDFMQAAFIGLPDQSSGGGAGLVTIDPRRISGKPDPKLASPSPASQSIAEDDFSRLLARAQAMGVDPTPRETMPQQITPVAPSRP